MSRLSVFMRTIDLDTRLVTSTGIGFTMSSISGIIHTAGIVSVELAEVAWKLLIQSMNKGRVVTENLVKMP